MQVRERVRVNIKRTIKYVRNGSSHTQKIVDQTSTVESTVLTGYRPLGPNQSEIFSFFGSGPVVDLFFGSGNPMTQQFIIFSMNVNVIPIVTILSSTGVTVLLLLFVSFYYCMKKVSA